MKTALPAVVLSLFAFCVQHLTLAGEVVLDFNYQPLQSGQPYHILDASNTGRGIQAEEIGSETCPVSVVMSIDPKRAIFHPVDPKLESIKIEEPLYITFSSVSECATSNNFTVETHGSSLYPLLIGPPVGKTVMPGTFHIRKTQDKSNVYNIAFKFHGIDEHLLAARPYLHHQDLLLVKLCSEQRLNVVFNLVKDPVPVPPPPAAH